MTTPLSQSQTFIDLENRVDVLESPSAVAATLGTNGVLAWTGTAGPVITIEVGNASGASSLQLSSIANVQAQQLILLVAASADGEFVISPTDIGNVRTPGNAPRVIQYGRSTWAGLYDGVNLKEVAFSDVSLPSPPPETGAYMDTTAALYMFAPRRIVAGFAQPIIRLRRVSDNAEMDFSAGAENILSVPDIAAWTGGTEPYVVKLYDQLGSANVAQQADPASQPLLDISADDPLGPSVVFNMLKPLRLSATTDHRNLSIVAGVQSMAMRTQNRFFEITGSTNATIYEALESRNTATNSDQLRSSTNAGGLTISATGGLYTAVRPMGIGFTGTTSERRFFANQLSSAGVANSATGPAGGVNIGASTANNSHFRMWGFAIYSALSVESMSSRMSEMATIVGETARASFDRRVVFAGDSIMFGTGADLLKNTPYWIGKEALVGTPELIDIGVPSSLMTGWDTNYAATGNGNSSAVWFTGEYGADRCILIVQPGTNDLSAGASGATVYAAASSLISKAKATGYLVGISTVIPRGSGFEVQRAAYNALVLANSGGADFIIDPTVDTHFDTAADSNDTTVYVDKTHPTDYGYSLLAPYYAAAINAAWDIPDEYRSDAQAYFDAAEAASGVDLSDATKGAFNDILFTRLESSGLRTKIDGIVFLANETAGASIVDLLNPATLWTQHGGLSFTALEGFTGNGTDAYFEGPVTIDGTGHFKRDDAWLAGWLTKTNSAGISYVGCATAITYLRPHASGSGQYVANGISAGAFNTAFGHRRGFYCTVRRNGTAQELYVNPASSTPSHTDTRASQAFTPAKPFGLRRGIDYSPDRIMFLAYGGGGLTGADVMELYDIIGDLAAALSVPLS